MADRGRRGGERRERRDRGGGEGSSRRSEPRARNERSERGDRGGRDSGSGRGRDGGRSGGGSANAQRGGGGGSRSRSTVPEAQLELDHVYGYHGSRCRNNLFYTATGEITYHIAALGIVYNPQTQKQRFFSGGHTDDIISMAIHPRGRIVATGQMGKDPYVSVWDTETCELLSYCKGFHERGVASIAFSPDGSHIATVGLDDRYSVAIWNWEHGELVASAKGHTDRIFEIAFDPFVPNTLVTVGVKHASFWRLVGNTLKKNKGIFGNKGPIQSMLCVAFGENGVAYTGTLSGDIYAWAEGRLVKVYPRVHQGPVYALFATPNGTACSSGKDGVIAMWRQEGNYWNLVDTLDLNTHVRTIENTAVVRAMCWNEAAETILVGLRSSEIYEVNDKNKGVVLHTAGHAEGEVWGLATSVAANVAVTASDDATVRLWNLDERKMTGVRPLPAEARSAAINPAGTEVAVGLKNGTFIVFSVRSLDEIDTGRTANRQKRRREVLHDIRYSPDGKVLAVASNDNFIDLYDASKGYRYLSTCKGHASFITHIDFSADSSLLISCDGGYEQLVFASPKGGRNVTTRGIKESTEWASWTGVLGAPVAGIWSRYMDKTDINAVDRSKSEALLATAGDDGKVKLLNFPATTKGAKSRVYEGHASHVTNVRFNHNDTLVLSTGGLDQALFQWRVSGVDASSAFRNVGAGSDSDGSDSGSGFDSDLEEEKNLDYSAPTVRAFTKPSVIPHASELMNSHRRGGSTTNDDDVLARSAPVIPSFGTRSGRRRAGGRSASSSSLGVGGSNVGSSSGLSGNVAFRSAPPEQSLQMEHCYGYRSRDARNNVWPTTDGAMVWHAGAVGVVYDPKQKRQRFYAQHTDDIVSLCLHPNGRYVATGQVGHEPSVRVWDSVTMETLAVLTGFHERAVSAVSFSGDGKWLLTVGADDYHSVAVYIWQKGILVASSKGSQNVIFVAEFNPHHNSHFVTCGIRNIDFWAIKGNGIVKKRGIFGRVSDPETIMDISFGANGKAYAGTKSGVILEWDEGELVRVIDAHQGPVYSVTHTPDGGFVSGSKDGKVMVWDGTFNRVSSVTLADVFGPDTDAGAFVVRSVMMASNGRMLVGTRDSAILEVDTRNNTGSILHQGHNVGELWGLSPHPTDQIFATASDDETLRVWDALKCTQVAQIALGEAARSCAYSPDGSLIAVGLKFGGVRAYDSAALALVADWKHRKEAIHVMSFSPNGELLAVGSNDNYVDIVRVRDFKRVGVCSGSSSYITQLDWSADSRLIQTNSGAYEHLFFQAPRGKRVPLSKRAQAEVEWDSFSSVLGPQVDGIWVGTNDKTDINTVQRSFDGSLLAVGDDFGMVKLYAWPPSSRDASFKIYQGHSAHVTRVVFTAGNRKLISIGGGDQTIIQWSVTRGGGNMPDINDAPTLDDGYDSDVDREVRAVYVPKETFMRARADAAAAAAASAQVDRGLSGLDGRGGGSGSTPSAAEVASSIEADLDALHTLRAPRRVASSSRSSNPNQEEALELAWVHGYRGHDSRANVFFADRNRYAWFTAAVGVIQDADAGRQTYHLGHDDDILSMAQSPASPNLFATGELGKDPAIHVWDGDSLEVLSILSGGHERGVVALAFTASGKRVVSVGLDNYHTVCVHKWSNGRMVATAKGSQDKVFAVATNPADETAFVIVGVKMTKFFNLAGNSLASKRGIFGDAGLQTMLCAAYSADGTACYTGSIKGQIYVWDGNKCSGTVDAHDGACYALIATPSGGIASGGKDGVIRLFDASLTPKRDINLGRLAERSMLGQRCVIRALNVDAGGRILAGTRTSEVFLVDPKGKRAELLTAGHGEGELWGLDTHSTDGSLFATASDDKTLRVWNANTHELVTGTVLPEAARSVAFAPSGDDVDERFDTGHLAVGFGDGSVRVYNGSDLAMVAEWKDRREMIGDIKFSPDGRWLAVASNDNLVDCYSVADAYVRVGCCGGSSSFITHIDWSDDSQFIQTNSGAYERLFFEMPRGTRVVPRDLPEGLRWATWTGVLGRPVAGIYPKYSDGTDVNATARSHSGTRLAIADDFGFVRLGAWPMDTRNAPSDKFVGHSSHVTSVRWTADDAWLISAGGMDKSILVWSVKQSIL